jgi:hypothetical protein
MNLNKICTEEDQMEEEKELFGGRVKCIYCGFDNFSEGSNRSDLVYWNHELSELDRLSEESGQDFLSVICNRCTVSLFLGTMGVMMYEDVIKRSLNEKTGHDIMSKVFFELLKKYNSSTRKYSHMQTANLSIDT